jgi:hypothetical protein
MVLISAAEREFTLNGGLSAYAVRVIDINIKIISKNLKAKIHFFICNILTN